MTLLLALLLSDLIGFVVFLAIGVPGCAVVLGADLLRWRREQRKVEGMFMEAMEARCADD